MGHTLVEACSADGDNRKYAKFYLKRDKYTARHGTDLADRQY